MGFLKNTSTIELRAKLTPEGRRKLVTNNNTLITSFRLGDSDAFYSVFSGLTGGQVPQISGDNEGKDTNNGAINYRLKSVVNYKPTIVAKPVEIPSISVNTTFEHLGFRDVVYSGASLSQLIVDLNDKNTDTFVNLFYSFGLPITASDFIKYTGETSSVGGYADTALSGIAQTKILVIGVDGDEYSELIDGKSIKMSLTTTGQTYDIYSTFEKKGTSLINEDANIRDSSINLTQFGPNVSLLFSDDIKKPNGNVSKSWATGYAQNKPFSLNSKALYNFVGNNSNLVADNAVGVAYLDKGFMVITEPSIVNDFSLTGTSSTATTISFDTVRNRVSQSVTCIANRGEFGISTNPTWTSSDIPRITEIGLYDSTNTLIAVGKLNKTYEKPVDDFVAFNITIDY